MTSTKRTLRRALAGVGIACALLLALALGVNGYVVLSTRDRVLSLAEGPRAPVAPGTQLGTARLTLNGETVLTVPLTCRTGVSDNRAPAGLLARIFGGGQA